MPSPAMGVPWAGPLGIPPLWDMAVGHGAHHAGPGLAPGSAPRQEPGTALCPTVLWMAWAACAARGDSTQVPALPGCVGIPDSHRKVIYGHGTVSVCGPAGSGTTCAAAPEPCRGPCTPPQPPSDTVLSVEGSVPAATLCIDPAALAGPVGSALVAGAAGTAPQCGQRVLFSQGDVGIAPVALAAGSSVFPAVPAGAADIAPRCRWWQRTLPCGAGGGSGRCPAVQAAAADVALRCRQQPQALPHSAGSFALSHRAPRAVFAQQPAPEGAAAEPSLLPGAACAALPGSSVQALPSVATFGGRGGQAAPCPGAGGAAPFPEGQAVPEPPVLAPCPCWLSARVGSLPVPSRSRRLCCSPGPCHIPRPPSTPGSPPCPMALGAIADGTNASASPEGPALLPPLSAQGHRPLGATACSARLGLGALPLPAPGAQQVTNIRSPPGRTGL